jgi:hypothetical protein
MIRFSACAVSTSSAIRRGPGTGGWLVQYVSTQTCRKIDSSSDRVGKRFGKYALRNITANCQGVIPLGGAVMHSAKLDLIRCTIDPRGSKLNDGIGGEAGGIPRPGIGTHGMFG